MQINLGPKELNMIMLSLCIFVSCWLIIRKLSSLIEKRSKIISMRYLAVNIQVVLDYFCLKKTLIAAYFPRYLLKSILAYLMMKH